jgi:hypothetical protein
LTTISTAHATPHFLPFFHPPIKLTSWRPRRCLDLERWVDFPAIGFGTLLQVVIAEVHI